MEKVSSSETPEISSYEEMQERGKYVANNYVFDVEPVYFGEEEEYAADNHLYLYMQSKDEKPNDKELAKYIIALFQIKDEEEVKNKLGLFGRAKLKLAKLFRKDYRYYSDSPSALGFIKWIERKVKYKGKHIRFYDLERKFKLNKTEIAGLYRYMEDLSGF